MAQSECDVEAAQKLRYRAICSNGRAADGVELDRDRYDVVCHHILTEDRSSGGLVCFFRILPISDAMPINASYSAQFYQLSALKKFQGRMVEMGRFCIAPPSKTRIFYGWLGPS